MLFFENFIHIYSAATFAHIKAHLDSYILRNVIGYSCPFLFLFLLNILDFLLVLEVLPFSIAVILEMWSRTPRGP